MKWSSHKYIEASLCTKKYIVPQPHHDSYRIDEQSKDNDYDTEFAHVEAYRTVNIRIRITKNQAE